MHLPTSDFWTLVSYKYNDVQDSAKDSAVPIFKVAFAAKPSKDDPKMFQKDESISWLYNVSQKLVKKADIKNRVQFYHISAFDSDNKLITAALFERDGIESFRYVLRKYVKPTNFVYTIQVFYTRVLNNDQVIKINKPRDEKKLDGFIPDGFEALLLSKSTNNHPLNNAVVATHFHCASLSLQHAGKWEYFILPSNKCLYNRKYPKRPKEEQDDKISKKIKLV